MSGTPSNQQVLGATAIANRELIAGIRREQLGYEAETFGQGLRCKQRIFALAKFGVVEVDRQRELVDRNSVGEGRIKKAGFGFFVDDWFAVYLLRSSVSGYREVAALPRVLAGLARHFLQRLSPHELVDALRHSSDGHEGVSYVDQELE